MIKKNLLYSYWVLTVFAITLASQTYAGEEGSAGVSNSLISRKTPVASSLSIKQNWLIEVFDLEESNYSAAHCRLDWMNKIYPALSESKGFLVGQKGSKRVKGLIRLFGNKQEADKYTADLRAIFVADQPHSLGAEMFSQPSFICEKVEVHSWKR